MLFTIQVNNKKIKAEKGETILSALNRNGIIIPTLCRMKDFTPTGACRMCVVEVEGRERLVTACSQPVEEWMTIRTHSPRVIQARRTIVELLLSRHPDDCLYCDRNLNCELQKLSAELNIDERRIKGKKIRSRLDHSGHSIVRELAKCILCGRCVRVCEEIITNTTLDFINKGQETRIGVAMDKDFNFSSCINCGQCIQVCPTGALSEKQNLREVQESLNNPEFISIIQYSPYVISGLAEELGFKPSRDSEKVLNSVLRKMGFSKVFHTGFGTDIMITELTAQLQERLLKKTGIPLYVSACPAWIKYAEQSMQGSLERISILKSPLQITGAIIKSMVADSLKVKPRQIFSVAVTPCTAMKFEARRDSMMRKGISEVDSVLTIRELARLIRLNGIDFSASDTEPADEPMDMRSSAAALSEISGGITESVIRMMLYNQGTREPDKALFKKLRGTGNFRDSSFKIGDIEVRAAVVDGLSGLAALNSQLASGILYDLVEVMVCPGGCVHGGGLPYCNSRETVRTRAKAVYLNEENDAVYLPPKSPSLTNFYEKADVDKTLFHTRFSKRDVLL
jgi:iron-only hydrogenase group A